MVPLPGIETWSDLGQAYVEPEYNLSINLKTETMDGLQKLIGYKFQNPLLLAQALVSLHTL